VDVRLAHVATQRWQRKHLLLSITMELLKSFLRLASGLYGVVTLALLAIISFKNSQEVRRGQSPHLNSCLANNLLTMFLRWARISASSVITTSLSLMLVTQANFFSPLTLIKL
jgi:hypothetical protein